MLGLGIIAPKETVQLPVGDIAAGRLPRGKSRVGTLDTSLQFGWGVSDLYLKRYPPLDLHPRVIRYIRCVVLKDPRVRMSRRQVSISPDDEG